MGIGISIVIGIGIDICAGAGLWIYAKYIQNWWFKKSQCSFAIISAKEAQIFMKF